MSGGEGRRDVEIIIVTRIGALLMGCGSQDKLERGSGGCTEGGIRGDKTVNI